MSWLTFAVLLLGVPLAYLTLACLIGTWLHRRGPVDDETR